MMLSSGQIVPLDLDGRPISGGYYTNLFRFKFNKTHGQEIQMPPDAVGKSGLLVSKTNGSSRNYKTTRVGFYLHGENQASQQIELFSPEKYWQTGNTKDKQQNITKIPKFYVGKEYSTGSAGAAKGFYDATPWFIADCILYY